MKSKENYVSESSDYYLYQPSTVASQIYLYPTVIGHFFYQAGYELKRTHYNSILLMSIIKGSCQVTLPDKSPNLVLAGQIALIDCYAPHAYRFDCDAEVSWLHFDGSLARRYYDLITASQGNVITPANSYPVNHGIEKMISLFRNSKPLKEAEASETITRMLDGLLNTRTYTGSQSSHSTVVGNALAYINERFSEPLTLEMIASNSGLSPFHFSRIFSAETGFTPHQYLIATRINSAKFLLKLPDIPIKEIAFGSGFNSESSFCSTFRKWEHMTPGEYRECADMPRK